MEDQKVRKLLSGVKNPITSLDLVTSGELKKINLNEKTITIELEFKYPMKSFKEAISDRITNALSNLYDKDNLKVVFNQKIDAKKTQKNTKLIKNIKNIIAVASAKGGVGKSTTAVNLAIALSKEGANVGLLDADIYGPSQQMMMGLKHKPESKDGKSIEPISKYGIETMSIGLLIDPDTPVVWRGPMVTGALEQLLNDTNWSDLDYLVIDLPPGTGDIQLTLAQKVPLTGALIITTPQDISLIDARKGLKMFEKVNVPILGIVENMSTYICPKCGNEDDIFGKGGGEQMCEDYGLELLAKLPLNKIIRENTDAGKPTALDNQENSINNIFKILAVKTAYKLSLLKKDYSLTFPDIIIKDD